MPSSKGDKKENDMDIENCAVTDDSLSLLEEEIKVLASKPKDFFTNFINNQKLFKQAVELFLRSEIAVHRIISSAKTQGVTGKDITEALRLIKKEAKENGSQIPSAIMKARIKDYLPTAPVADEATLPVGYKFLGNCGISVGLHNGPDSIVSSYPLFITCIKHNRLTGIEYVTLLWIVDGIKRSITVERKVIAKKSQIVDLASHGLPITSTNADEIIDYLFAYEKTNAHCVDKVEATHKLGWTPDMEGFLWGHQFFLGQKPDPSSGKQPVIEFLGRDQGDEQIADGFCSKGGYREWISLVNDILIYPDVAFLLYASLATPLLPVLGVQNFSLELSNPSSSGKTSALLLGASAWGAPELHSNSFVNTWYATPVWIGRAASILNGLPLYLDETKLVHSQDRRERAGEIVSRTFYMITAGKDKARGTLQGTERTEPFRTILFSTGESPSLNLSNNGGSKGRLIDLCGNPFFKTDAESKSVVDRVNWTIQENYGHAGPRVVQFILDHRDQWNFWKEAYREADSILTKSEEMSPIEMRLGEYFAFITTAIPIIHAALPELRRDRPVKELLGSVWDRARNEAREADVLTKVLNIIQSYIINNNEMIYSKTLSEDNVPWDRKSYIGYQDIDSNDNWSFVGLYPEVFNELLKKNGYDPSVILNDLKLKNLLSLTSTKGYARDVKIPGTSVKGKMKGLSLYCLKKEAFNFN